MVEEDWKKHETEWPQKAKNCKDKPLAGGKACKAIIYYTPYF